MAWRFDEHILRGELDNRTRGRVSGLIWLAGAAEPLGLELRGDCAPDLAGCLLTFENPQAQPMTGDLPAAVQRGWVGDITAAQKLKVPDVPIEEFIRRKDAPWHWANAVYLEWFSQANGRVVVQTADFTLTISTPAWTLTDEEYLASREASGQGHTEWMEQMVGPLTGQVEAVEVGELLHERDDEGEEWKRAGGEEDGSLVLDPFDDAEWMPVRAILVREGFTPLASDAVDDAQLRGRLWELIYALAGRRIFLEHTDHLGDRALYQWLEGFLDEDCADCPPEAETNHRVDVSEFSCGTDGGTEMWLRYYANEAERQQWADDFPGDEIPPGEKPPHDRDRFLPEPPRPLPTWTPPDSDEDPLGLEDVDREIRIESLKQEIAETTGDEFSETKSADVPPAAEEAYLEQVRDTERDGWQRPIDQLSAQGAAPLPPSELTDETITAKLWELLHNLAWQGFYVLHTDHFSDRELYTALWEKGLREEAILPGRSRSGGWFHDFIGSGSDEHEALWLRHYADEEARARRARNSPDLELPPPEPPPHRRDWRLPKGPF
ncbi:MAG: hypothetical protein QOE70_3844 [Chthoniobacter sp.]|jgi:hypothetical protein|nr:hypothetical protein [Chthoniobacter sp.]